MRIDDGEQSSIFKPYLGMKVWELRHMVVNRFIDKHRISTILDLGCSEGSLLQRLGRCPDIKLLVGIDIDDEAISKAILVTI